VKYLKAKMLQAAPRVTNKKRNGTKREKVVKRPQANLYRDRSASHCAPVHEAKGSSGE
jgi:hypothetical protein